MNLIELGDNMNFDKAFELVVGAEGGYTDDPNDAGNWTDGKARGEDGGVLMGTKYGIAANTYGKSLAAAGKTIKDLTLADAKAIYKRDFWDKCQCDDLPDMHNYPVFSCAVNCSPQRAAQFYQRALGVPADGIIGSITTKAARTYRNQAGLLDEFLNNWLGYYEHLANTDPRHQKYIKGWKNRIKEVVKNNG